MTFPGTHKRFLWAVLLPIALLPTAAEAGKFVEDAAFGRQLHQHLAAAMSNASAQVWVVKIKTAAQKSRTGQQHVGVEVVADLRADERFQPREEQLSFSTYNHRKMPKAGDQLYVVVVNQISYRQPKKEATKLWMLAGGQTPWLEVPGADLASLQAVRQVFWARGKNAEQARLKHALEMLEHDNAAVRAFAGECFVKGVNGKLIPSGDTTAAAAVARVVLDSKDVALRRALAAAFESNRSGLSLPTEMDLLVRLLKVNDVATASAVARALRRQGKNAAHWSEALIQFLDSPDSEPQTVTQLLTSVHGWGANAAPFTEVAHRIARGKTDAPPEPRLAALGLVLSRSDSEVQDALARDLLLELPSAQLLAHIVNRRMNDMVPTILDAMDSGKLQWSEGYGLALRLLTGRHEDPGSAQPRGWIDWWADIRKAGRDRGLLAANFHDDVMDRQLETLVGQLGSSRYAERVGARRELAARSFTPRTAAIARGLESGNREVVHSLMVLLEDQDRRVGDLRKALDRLAASERAGRCVLSLPSQDAAPAPAKKGG